MESKREPLNHLPDPKRQPSRRLPSGWWPELLALVETLEAGTADQSGAAPRPIAEVCEEVERLAGSSLEMPLPPIAPKQPRSPWRLLLRRKRR
jgi:hypothetical protein